VKGLKQFALAAAFACAALPSFAQQAQKDIKAEFVDGAVEYKSGGSWKPMDIGDSFTDDQLKAVRLGKRSYAEFSLRGRRLVLSAAGTYDVPTLFAKPAPAVASGIGNRVQKLIAETKTRNAGVAMGVRAEKAEDPNLMIGDEYSFFEAGKQAILEGDLELGEGYLSRAWSSAEGSDDEAIRSSISYYLGLGLASGGSVARALKSMRAASWYGEPSIAQDYIALQLSLEVQSNAASEAKALVKQAVSKSKDLGLEPAFLEDLKRISADL